MSKLTFRADDELVERLEAIGSSKSRIMREALREYLDSLDSPGVDPDLEGDVAELVAEHLEGNQPSIDLTIHLDAPLESVDVSSSDVVTVEAEEHSATPCPQCGEPLSPSHVFCPNCGEKGSRRAYCDCGTELRSDWSYCPGCGRRTPAADVLDS